MAGLLGFPGIEVTVVSGHGEPATFKPLNQYPDPEHKWAAEYASVQPTKRSASYLECETDAEFHIKVDINPDCKFAPASLTIRFLVDGTPICAVNLNEEVSIKEVNTIRGIISQVSAHERTITPMKFCSITKVDDGNNARVTQDIALSKNLGEILVDFHRTKLSTVAPYISNKRETKSLTEISEKALKGQAKSHGIAYGEAKREVGSSTTSVTYLDGQENPVGVILLKYRSREALMSELIIPRSESPEPILTASQQRDLNASANNPESPQQRIARLERELAAVKAEAGAINTSIKQERRNKRKSEGDEIPRSGRAYKTSVKRNGNVVIDLTDD